MRLRASDIMFFVILLVFAIFWIWTLKLEQDERRAKTSTQLQP